MFLEELGAGRGLSASRSGQGKKQSKAQNRALHAIRLSEQTAQAGIPAGVGVCRVGRSGRVNSIPMDARVKVPRLRKKAGGSTNAAACPNTWLNPNYLELATALLLATAWARLLIKPFCSGVKRAGLCTPEVHRAGHPVDDDGNVHARLQHLAHQLHVETLRILWSYPVAP